MTGAPARVADYAPKDESIAGLLEHRRLLKACAFNSDYALVDEASSEHVILTRLDAIRARIVRRAEDLFLMSMRAEMRALEALESHDAEAEGAIHEVTAAATEARDAVIKLRTEVRLSGTDPFAHPTEELVRATTALTHAEQHVVMTECELSAVRTGLESVWTSAARQLVQDGVMLFGAIGEHGIESSTFADPGINGPLPKNLTPLRAALGDGQRASCYPLPVYELREVLHREKPAQRYEAGATS